MTYAVRVAQADTVAATAPPFAMPVDTLTSAAAQGLAAADLAVNEWLKLGPTAADLLPVLGSAVQNHDSMPGWASGLREWAVSPNTSKKDRSDALRQLIAWPKDTTAWIGAISESEYNERGLMTAVRERMRRPRNNDADRLLLAEKAAALKPKTADGKRALARIALWLLGAERTIGDVHAAAVAVAGLSGDFEGKQLLRQGFKRAAERKNTRLSAREARNLVDAGIEVPPESVGKKVLKKVRGWAGI
jgi:hypothetical protein